MKKSESKKTALKFFKGVKMKPFQYSQEYHDLAMKDIELQSDPDRWKKPSIWSEYDSKKKQMTDDHNKKSQLTNGQHLSTRSQKSTDTAKIQRNSESQRE